MDRRAFLSRSALGSGAVVLGAGCGAAPARPELDAAQVSELLARLDRGLGAIRDVPVGEIARAIPWEVRPDLHESVMRTTLESLVVTDVARGIADPASMPRALRERMIEVAPIVERSIDVHHALLTRMPPAIRRRTNERLRERPALPLDVAEWIDRHAIEIGIARESRLRLRQTAVSVETRVRRQSANAVIEDAIAKVDRAVARGGEALARRAGTTALVDAIWAQSGAVLAPPGAYVGPEAGETGEEPRWNERWGRPGDEEIEIGAIMMPFGLLSCGLFLIIGLVVLICGVVQNGEWNGESEDERRARERTYAPWPRR